MAKLQHTFIKGKMNKDLDERLIPNGEYRDASNVQVSTSEGADVGAVENIIGNTIQNKRDDTTSFTTWPANFGLVNASCIGIAKDSQNEKIYWFVTSNTADIILQYDQVTKTVKPILVDSNGAILKFNVNNLITGVNVLSDMLMWTDNLNEPRSIKISVFEAGSRQTTNLATGWTSTSVYGTPGFLASEITVIKLKPEAAPNVVALPSLRGGNGTGITPVTTIFNFTDTVGTQTPPKEVGSTVNITTNVAPNWIDGDIIVLNASRFTRTFTKIEYEVRLIFKSRVNLVSTCEISSVSLDIDSANYEWSCILEEVEPFFELQFPRFAYRWKYAQNQYSPFSPFTQAVFIPSEYDYSDANAYNESMVNNIRSLTLNTFAPPPADVVEVDILFKESNSTTIYKVDSITPTTTSFSITSELIYNVINSDQTIRPYDNVPKRAKSQEIIGNRLVYGNYAQNYDITAPALITTVGTSSDITTLNFPEQSIKSLRTYQVGIVYLDASGRETPVFTNNTAAVTIQGDVALKSTVLKVTSAQAAPPASIGITAFKYYVKDISNEYYNLVLDRYYDAADGNVWLSFPSAERNKIQIDDFIVLKKAHGSDEAVTETPRYKIIDISNEVPESVATIRREAAKDQGTRGAPVKGVFIPIKNGLSSFQINGPTRSENPEFFDVWSSGLKLSIQFSHHVITNPATSTIETSAFYDIESGGFNGLSTTSYDINLTEIISEPAWVNNLVTADLVRVVIRTEVIQKSSAFEGKFFAKINRDALFEDYVLFNFTDNIKDYNETHGITLEQNLPAIGLNPNPPAARFGWKETLVPVGGTAVVNPAVMALPEFGLYTFGFGYAPYENATYGSASNNSFIANLVAGKIIVVEDNVGNKSTLGTIESVSFAAVTGRGPVDTEIRHQWGITLKDFFDTNLPEGAFWTRISLYERKRTNTIVFNQESKPLASPNPAIFETEPSESIDLELYYEASDAIPIGNLGNQQTLPYFNCYSYGNGVESNRIRDDFNAKVIGKGSKVSSVLDDVYSEETRGAGLIHSGIFNSTSGVNELNQFIAGLNITKDLNPIYGAIQKLYARDTDLVVLAEDKCFRVLADKNALFNADGSSNVAASNRVLGSVTPFVGEFGISKNPESFASFGFRTYFVDKARGAVMRLSRDGLTKISSNGMSDYFIDNLKLNTTGDIMGSYDSDAGSYNVCINVPNVRTNPGQNPPAFSNSTESVAFKEKVNGWTTTMSYIPEAGISLNNEYYTFKNGEMWEHSNETRSNFYTVQHDSTVTPIINDAPTSVKNFKTLSYEGTAGWTAEIKTDQQDGAVTNWQKREGSFYNFIKGIASTWDYDTQKGTLDTQETSVQGIGTILAFGAAGGKFTITIKGAINDSLQIIPSDKIYYLNVTDNKIEEVGACTAIVGPVLTITPVGALNTDPSNGDFLFFAKDNVVNTSGIIGYFAETKMRTQDSTKEELFAVTAEVFISSE